MDMQRGIQISVLILTSLFFSAVESHGQADPKWLKSWEEAQEQRPASLTSRSTIAAKGEPGTPLVVRGTVLSPGGAPAGDVIVHAYHRDSEGYEFGLHDKVLTTWELQGWVQTDAEGQFEFHTIRPAPDHHGREGSHLHFTLESEEFGRQWATKIFLADDPKVTEAQKQRSKEVGKFGGVREVKVVGGVESIDISFKLKKLSDF